MIEEAMLHIGVAKVSVTNGAREGVTLTDWALAYLAKGRSFLPAISAASFLNRNSPFKLLLFEPALAILIGQGVCLFENYTSRSTTELAIGTIMALPLQFISCS